MTSTAPTWMDPPHMHHATISEAGDCPECRDWNISLLKDGSHAYLLMFQPVGGAPPALSLVRDWAPDGLGASEAAWATGCNVPRCARIEEIPVGVAIESGVEMFRLHEGVEADDAFRAIHELV